MTADGPTLPANEPPEAEQRYQTIQKVTIVGSIVDLLLGVGKILGGWLAHSEALIADGVHSLSDLVTDLGVIVAARHSHPYPDADHPYGHGRVETVATAGLAVALILVSVGIAVDAISSLFNPDQLLVPTLAALVIAAISVLAKETVYHYTMRYARQLKSKLLRANAWHSRSDAASSIVVIIGVAGTMMGLEYLDAIAAVIVAWMVGRIGLRLGKESIRELIDTGLGRDRISQIHEQILAVDGVEDLHMLRTRQMGGRAFIDVHINLADPRSSASEAHHVSEQVRRRLIETIEDVDDVTVHTDTEDDHGAIRTDRLPPRAAIVARLKQRWQGIAAAQHIRRITLHYMQGRIDVEVELPLEAASTRSQATELRTELSAALEAEQEINEVRLLLS